MKYKTVLFDFDGTLMDTSIGILQCATKTLTDLGVAIPPENIFRKFIGPPLKLSFVDVCGMSDEDAERAVTLYRQKYAEGGMFEAKVYPGMVDLLKKLDNAGVKCAVASVKMEKIVRTTMPVSYTHLDVYKRQVRYFADDFAAVWNAADCAGNRRACRYGEAV